MDGQQDLGALARAIIDANLYMTLGTVDHDGRPWVAPVFYAAVLMWSSPGSWTSWSAPPRAT
jgi:hypothetical protein